MDRIDVSQARDHVEMVEEILARSQQRLCAGGEFFVVWGLFSGIVTAIWQLVDNGVLPRTALWVSAVALAIAIVFSVLRGRYYSQHGERRSFLEGEFFNVLWLTIGLAFIANVAAFNLFSGWAQAAIWTFAESIVLLYIGLHGNRRALICGVVMVASMVAANFVSAGIAGYVLAAGMIVGYAGFGIADMLATS
ncbi:MAG: hypothetical protein JO092_07615 [Candidatus Eremiobacteraeota bacterium]|nr:hypothetical protein [Candidatus Eremiobacteraeota bacterium]